MPFQAAQWLPFFRPRPVMQATPEIRGVTYRAAVAALQDAGFWVLREGIHVVLTNGTRVLTIPCNDPVHAIALEGIVRDAGLTMEHFQQLL
jgi:predicted RNA binding protein YcfA (HicA-like mRNA interferase family)